MDEQRIPQSWMFTAIPASADPSCALDALQVWLPQSHPTRCFDETPWWSKCDDRAAARPFLLLEYERASELKIKSLIDDWTDVRRNLIVHGDPAQDPPWISVTDYGPLLSRLVLYAPAVTTLVSSMEGAGSPTAAQACRDFLANAARMPATERSSSALPTWSDMAFATRVCSEPTVPRHAGRAMVDAQLWRLFATGVVRATELTYYLAAALTESRVTVQDMQLVRDHRAGLVRLVDAILFALRLMLARLRSALAHRPTVAAFLLVMLRSLRHYGHRGEPDHLSPLPLALTSDRQRGAVRLAA
jgi:hypothetical protein